MKNNYVAFFTIFLLIISIIPLALSSNSFVNNDFKDGILVPSYGLGSSYGINVLKENIVIKDYSSSVTIYKVVDESRDKIIKSGYMKPQSNSPSEEEAKDIADSYLSSHGGIPEDAVVSYIEPQYLKKIDYTTGEILETRSLGIDVNYGRIINGMQVAGPGDFIMVSVGGDGKVLCHLGSWRSLEEAGEVEVISPDTALSRLENGQVIDRPLSPIRGSLTVNEMCLGYYSEASLVYQEFYQPIWIFKGVDSQGENIELAVEATFQ